METISQAMEYNQQGRILYGLDKSQEALRMYEKAREADPTCVETYLNMAELYIAGRDYEKAKDILKKVFFLEKNNGEALFHLGNIAYLEGNLDEARIQYRKALESDYRNPRVAYHLASLYLDMGDPGNALFYLDQVLREDPYHVGARLRKIEILITQEKYEEPVRSADQLIERKPDTFEGYHYKFVTLLGLGRLDECRKVLEYAQHLFPRDLGFVYDQIKYYEHIEDYDAALALMDDRFRENPEDWRNIRKEKAKVLFARQDLDAAKALLEELEQEAHDDEMCYCLMQLYGGYGEYPKAVECCQRIIGHGEEGEYYFAALYHEAVGLEKMGEKAKAREKYQEAANRFRFACSQYPGDLILYLYRALCYRRLGDYDRALEMVEYLIAVSDDSMAEAYYVRGLIYESLHDMEKAEKDKKRGLSMSPMLASVLSEE